jgi:hypothetical protein
LCERATRRQTQILKGRGGNTTNPKDQRLNMRVHKECSLVDLRPPMLVHSRLRLQGVKHYYISLTKVVEMMWMKKKIRFLYKCGIPFNVLRSPYWHEMLQVINGAPKGYRSPEYDKAGTLGLDRERAKIQGALGKFTNDWNRHRVSIDLIVGKMCKAGH